MPEELLVPFPVPRERVPMATKVRSTLITSSIGSVRARGLVDRYAALLPHEHREALLTAVAGVWLPIALGVAHYDACDRLGFSGAEQVSIGQEVGNRIQGTMLGVLLRTAKGAGMTPWTAILQTPRLWDRLFMGGGVSISKLGPKEGRLEIAGVPLAALTYFRAGFRGLAQSGCELFCERAYVTEVQRLCTPTALTLKISWA